MFTVRFGTIEIFRFAQDDNGERAEIKLTLNV